MRLTALQASAVDPDSLALLARMAAAHRDVKTFSCRIRMRASAGGREEMSTAFLQIQRPGSAAISVGENVKALSVVASGTDRRVIRDGKAIWTRGVRPDKAISEALSGAEFFTSPVFPLLVGAPNAADRILPGKAVRLGRGNDEVLDGVPTDVVVADVETPGGTARLTFSIGRTDHFLRRVRIQARRGGSAMDLSEVYTDINVDGPIEPTVFRLDPPNRSAPAPRPLRVPPPKGKAR